MKNVDEYLYPSDVTEAMSFLKEKEKSTFIAGGTHLTSGRSRNISCLIDITRLGLNEIKKNDDLIEVGATTTISEMYESPLIAKIGNGLLSKACQLIADTPLRNKITLGGNIAHLFPWAGLPVVLLTLDAKIHIQRQNSEVYTLSTDDYFTKGAVPTGELITGVTFPIKSGWFHRYEKFALTTVDYSWLTIAFAAKVQDGKIIDSRVAVSRIIKVKRISEVEAILKDQNIATLDINEAVQTLQSAIEIVQDYRSSKGYRRQLLGALFKRMLQQLKEDS